MSKSITLEKIIDLGKRRRKDIKRLKKGKGRLVACVLEELASRKIEGPVYVVLVRQRDRRCFRAFGRMPKGRRTGRAVRRVVRDVTKAFV